jgi:F-type H+-transporting ATPase subunit b
MARKRKKVSAVLVLLVAICVLAISNAVVCMIAIRSIEPKVAKVQEEYGTYVVPSEKEGAQKISPVQFVPKKAFSELEYVVWKLAGNREDELAIDLLPAAREKTVRLEDLVWRIANFSVLLLILHVLLTHRIARFLTDRRSAIADALDEAEKARRESKKKYDEVNRMLEKAKQEIDDIHASFITEGQRERDRLIKNAEREAEKIKKQAEQAAVQEVRKARFALRAEAADLAVEMAEEVLKKNIKEKDQKRIVKEFIDRTSELK